MASPTQWTWVWVNPRSWWWTGRPGVLQFTGSQRVRHDWVTQLNWKNFHSLETCSSIWGKFQPVRSQFGREGLPSCGTSGKEPTCQWKRRKRWEFKPWVRKSPWRREWQPTPVFFPGEFHGQRILAGYSPWGRKESDTTECPMLLVGNSEEVKKKERGWRQQHDSLPWVKHFTFISSLQGSCYFYH